MKFPYGIADFHKLITAGYFYADRTGHIPAIENAGEQFRELTSRNQELARQETQLRQYAAELEQRFLAVTGEPLLIEV